MRRIPNEQFFLWVENEIAEGHSVRFRLRGDSMYPLLRNGLDEVILYTCKNKELKPMDIVLFRYKGKYLLHRIIKIDGNRLSMQGDGSIVAKEECLYSDVIGKVKAIVRPSGRIISLNSWQWRFFSFLWRRLGIIRPIILKAIFKLKRL